ncbi:hypothetical protein N2152v2_007643 [Parachlorella kessleri]
MASDAAVQGVSGAIGGIVATIATYPLMTVTTRQATRVKEEPVVGEAGAVLKRPIVRSSGIGGLFGGLGTALFGTTISQGIYFYLYSLLRALAVERRQAAEARAAGAVTVALAAAAHGQGDITVAESLLVAALAGAGNVLLTNPVWMIATRMQVQRKQKPQPVRQERRAGAAAAAEEGGGGVRQEVDVVVDEGGDVPAPSFLAVCRSVYQEYGIKGFWNGVGASLVMVINPTLQYALYEWLIKVRAAARRREQRQLQGKAAAVAPTRASALEVFLLSALAKAGATIVTYPMLTIKTRLYTAKKGDKEMQYAGIADAATQILRREGLAGYYKGLNSKIVQSVLAAAILFVCKEKITDFARTLLHVAARNKAQRAIA